MERPIKRFRFALVVAASVLALLLVAMLAGGPILGAFGRWLVFQKTDFKQVDEIVVLEGSLGDRAQEGADLFKQHRGARIVLVREKRDLELRRLDKLGIHIPGDCDLNRAALIKLGVPEESIEIVPGDVDSTWEEAVAFSRHARERGVKSAVVVTCPFHTRRAYLNFRRASAGQVAIYTIATRYCEQNPSAWWRDRDQLKTMYIEIANLIAYTLGYR